MLVIIFNVYHSKTIWSILKTFQVTHNQMETFLVGGSIQTKIFSTHLYLFFNFTIIILCLSFVYVNDIGIDLYILICHQPFSLYILWAFSLCC
jgi:hypothetical protein